MNDCDISLNSDTSSDEEITQIISDSKKPKKFVGMIDDAESMAPSTSTYRTKNEIDQNDIEQIIKFMPKMVSQIDSIGELGVVKTFFAPHTLLVDRTEEGGDVLDLDNFVCNEHKELIGFIDEVVGPIKDPCYAVVLYPAFRENLEKQELDIGKYFEGQKMYFVEKTKKLVFWNNILNQKGCDASNMFDEEADGDEEEEFSDEEQEKAYKKIVNKVKNQRKRKRKELGRQMQPNSTYAPDQAFGNKKRDMKEIQMAAQYPVQAPYPYMQQPNMYGHGVPPPYQQPPYMQMYEYAPPPLGTFQSFAPPSYPSPTNAPATPSFGYQNNQYQPKK